MTGLEKIIEQIDSDNAARCAQIIESADRQAEEIKLSAKKNTEAEAAKIVAAAEDKCRTIGEISSVKCQQIAKQKVLETKISLINGIIDDASSKLNALPDNDYFEFLLKLIKKYSKAGKCDLLLNAKDSARVTEPFLAECKKIAAENGAELNLSEEKADIANGFILRYGLIEINCSFDALINEYREDIKEKVNTILFQGA